MARRRKKGKPPTDKGLREVYDLAMHTKRTLRPITVTQAWSDMVSSARRQIFANYKVHGLEAAESVHRGALRELEKWVKDGALSAEEAKPVRENLDSFINAIRKKEGQKKK